MSRESMNIYCTIVLLTMSTSKTFAKSEAHRCPTWYLPVTDNSSSEERCECKFEIEGILLCERNHRVRLLNLRCMTYEPAVNATIEGYCPYGYSKNLNSALGFQPRNISNLNNFTCSWLNRTGSLCSHCKKSLGVAVLSFKYECTECLGSFRGWSLYLTLTFIPLTMFFLVVIVLDIDATAAPMNSILCIIQILLYSLNTNPQSFISIHPVARKLATGIWTVTGIWNLDFFRYVYPPFCISENLSILSIITMEYIVAFYPLLLIMVGYVLIKLHDNGFKPIRIASLLVKQCVNYISIKSNHSIKFHPKSSVIKLFSTFLLLAYTKILFVNFNLLGVTEITRSDGLPFKKEYYTLYNASIEYMSSQHLPYFILALINFMLFNVSPSIILLFYPTKIFQKILNSCRCLQWHPLHAFADKFQGCYKDGTDKSRDYRYFAGLYLLFRILYHLRVIWNNKYSIFLSQLFPLTAATAFALFHPYKNDFYNRLDCGFFSLLTLGQIILATHRDIPSLPVSLLYVLSIIFLAYMSILVSIKCSSICASKCTKRLRNWLVRKLQDNNLSFSFKPCAQDDEDLMEYQSSENSSLVTSEQSGNYQRHVTTYSTYKI